MTTTMDCRTNPNLLGRLHQAPANQEAWADFVQRYAPQVYRWCRKGGLQEADAEDVTQEVLLLLVAKMKAFVYDPQLHFRGWLRTVARHALGAFLKGRAREGQGPGGDKALAWLKTVMAREDLGERLEAEFDAELLDEAMARVRLRVEPRTWDAFRLLALEGLPGAEAAQQLGMRVATVFVARSKVQRMIRQEGERLEEREGE